MEESLRAHVAAAVLALSLVACGGRAAPPSPDQPPATLPPDLSGARVMVIPAQAAPGGSPVGEPVPGLDREIAYWLTERTPRVKWVFPPEIERALERSPSIEVDIHALNVASFHRAQVQIVGDPLFGDLRRTGALVDARFALIPVAAAHVPNATGPGRVEMSVALIDTVGGRVLWFGVMAGQPGPLSNPATVATAASALANLLAR